MRIVKRPGTCESMKVIALCEMGRWSFSMFLRFNFWVSVSHVLSLGFACVFNTIMEPSCWEGERWWILLREKVRKFRDMPHPSDHDNSCLIIRDIAHKEIDSQCARDTLLQGLTMHLARTLELTKTKESAARGSRHGAASSGQSVWSNLMSKVFRNTVHSSVANVYEKLSYASENSIKHLHVPAGSLLRHISFKLLKASEEILCRGSGGGVSIETICEALLNLGLRLGGRVWPRKGRQFHLTVARSILSDVEVFLEQYVSGNHLIKYTSQCPYVHLSCKHVLENEFGSPIAGGSPDFKAVEFRI